MQISLGGVGKRFEGATFFFGGGGEKSVYVWDTCRKIFLMFIIWILNCVT